MTEEDLDGFENSPSQRRLPFIEADESGSDYVLELTSAFYGNGFNGDLAVFEYKVIEAIGNKVNPVGSECKSLIQIVPKYKKLRFGAIRDQLAALLKRSPKEVSRQDLLTHTDGNENAAEKSLVGTRVRCHAELNEEGTWTNTTFSPA